MLPMFKTVQWKSFPRDFLIAQVGFAIYGLAIALIIQAELGTGPWAVLAVALADLTGTTPGTGQHSVYWTLAGSFLNHDSLPGRTPGVTNSGPSDLDFAQWYCHGGLSQRECWSWSPGLSHAGSLAGIGQRYPFIPGCD